MKTTALATRPAGLTPVESIAIKGDISDLTPEERSRYYIDLCLELGLNPNSQPFLILKLNGREILYPTKQATDQLAFNHKVVREIIDGPREELNLGTKMVYCKCRATLPNGRTETSIATLPIKDVFNDLMKVESKAKRRATLSILGFGTLDHESINIDTIEQTPDEQEFNSWSEGISKAGFQQLYNMGNTINSLPEPMRSNVFKLYVDRWVEGIKRSAANLDHVRAIWARVCSLPKPLNGEVKIATLPTFRAIGYTPPEDPTPPAGNPKIIEVVPVTEEDEERRAIQSEPTGSPLSRHFTGDRDGKAWAHHLTECDSYAHVANSYNKRVQYFRAHEVLVERHEATVAEIVLRNGCTIAEANKTIESIAKRTKTSNKVLRLVRVAA